MKTESKVNASHLERKVCVYVRQSSLAQVAEHQESTRRQYALSERARALGWREEQIVVIDEDLGQSASDIGRVRAGYQHLLGEMVGGQVGAVLSVEISRLARQDSEGYKLVEIAALMGVLLADESQIYDPQQSDDRLMLGLKVLLSSNEIRLMRQRLQENKVRKAQRGQLRLQLPIGLVNEPGGGVRLDPNEAVQGAVRLVFERFRTSGRQSEVVRYFNQCGLRFPRRRGNWDGPLEWGRLSVQRVHHILTNPLYAGMYVYGRSQRLPQPAEGGRVRRKTQPRPVEEWQVVQKDAFEGYLSHAEYESNQQRLESYLRRHRRRDGTALLGGMVLCGRCGKRMYVFYNGDGGRFSTYVCSTNQGRFAEHVCQRVPSTSVDRAITQRLLDALSPAQIELSLAAFAELERQQAELDQQWQRQLEGARYAVNLAQRRYEQTEPENRLVARQLEAHWEKQLREVTRLEKEYLHFCQSQPPQLNPSQRQSLLALARDLPRLWHAETTTLAERKSLIELLAADFTLIRNAEGIHVQIRWHTNQVETLILPMPKRGGPSTPIEIVERIRALYATHTDQQIANLLNQDGCRTVYGAPFNSRLVADTRRRNHLRKR
jgi:DNA invertase Pin-like site-specific DNA recombinase